MLQILGLGAGGLKLLTLEAYQALKQADKVYLRTKKHPAVTDLEREGIVFESFDYLYEDCESFDQVYQTIAEKIINLVDSGDNIIYGVPGHPLVAEDTVQKIISNLDDSDYQIIAGPSFIDAIFTTLEIDPITGIKIIDGLNFTARDLEPSIATIISQVYNQMIASEVKLTLMEIYPDDFMVTVIRGAGLVDQRIEEVPLYQLDRLEWIDHLSSIYLPIDQDNNRRFNRLLEIMEILRRPDGCPWDLEQDHYSLKKHLIEEAYEVVERIEEDDLWGMANELGDVLLQIVFHAQIAKQEGIFTIYDVIEEINEKMIRRHPHIFAQVQVEDSDEVVDNWEEIKRQEKARNGKEELVSILDSVPIQLPALMQAQKIQSKVGKVGFEWPEVDGALDKVEEEIAELKAEIKKNNSKEIKEELGDLLFSLVNIAKFLGIDAEFSLRQTINKFKSRFNYIEEKVAEQNKELTNFSLEELDKFWEEAKEIRRRN
ncbi:tetrapyrrole methylase family protein/MazG family protein [Orenia metallireducens]|uniref:Tetrapyrrole methylase family protein / MazG family protein n=1 Tax=Orenia metallireducens TaxID=1413210 RepID=A0A285H0C5_9FIRM|nr:nucleoside triphosphate pyrophosphohydrolase [Orenia metallireducens]PRX21784.1 tetrapyrrole methylase family protein/MazG family protein [Orenia metallireducens]SNY29004.1 tetrapyrrole methylase family protein / MazG family protein [Orenia metallireducens]